MVTREMVEQAQRGQGYCFGVALLCAIVYGAAWYFRGPEWISGISMMIGGIALLALYFLSLTEDEKEHEEWYAKNANCVDCHPSMFSDIEWMWVLIEYRRKWRGEKSLV